MAASIDVLDISHGKPFIISAHTRVSASVYLTSDNGYNDIGDQRAQTWNHDPVQDAGHNKDYAATMQWHINGNGDGTYTIRTNPNRRALTFKLESISAWITDHTGGDNQRWFFTPVASVMGNAYSISSAENPHYYLSQESEEAVDHYVWMRRTWDGSPPNMISTWYIAPVPSDLEKMFGPAA